MAMFVRPNMFRMSFQNLTHPQTLWFMQAHLNDLATADKDSRSFTICQRVLLRCHEIIFEDTPKLESGPYSTMKVKSRKLQRRRRVKHHIEPALVGIGCVLAGAPGMPTLTEIMGQAALEQGRAEETVQHYRSLEVEDDEDDDGVVGPSLPRKPDDTEGDYEYREDDEESGNEDTAEGMQMERSNSAHEQNPNIPLAAGAVSRSRSQRLTEASQTTPSFSRVSAEIRRSEAADDPFGQLDGPAMPVLPSYSTPAVPIARRSRQSHSGNVIDDVLRSYDAEAQRALLQSHYCRSEVYGDSKSLNPL